MSIKYPSSITVLNPFHGLTFDLAPNEKLNEVYSICTNIMQTITFKYLLRYGCKYMKTSIVHILYS